MVSKFGLAVCSLAQTQLVSAHAVTGIHYDSNRNHTVHGFLSTP